MVKSLPFILQEFNSPPQRQTMPSTLLPICLCFLSTFSLIPSKHFEGKYCPHFIDKEKWNTERIINLLKIIIIHRHPCYLHFATSHPPRSMTEIIRFHSEHDAAPCLLCSTSHPLTAARWQEQPIPRLPTRSSPHRCLWRRQHDTPTAANAADPHASRSWVPRSAQSILLACRDSPGEAEMGDCCFLQPQAPPLWISVFENLTPSEKEH